MRDVGSIPIRNKAGFICTMRRPIILGWGLFFYFKTLFLFFLSCVQLCGEFIQLLQVTVFNFVMVHLQVVIFFYLLLFVWTEIVQNKGLEHITVDDLVAEITPKGRGIYKLPLRHDLHFVLKL
jgi:uncharacterized membrane protein YcgQ (UPF0703/DUF1980 family)